MESLENEQSRAHSPSFLSLHIRHSSFSNISVALPTSQLIVQPFCCFTYVTAHSATLLLLLLRHRLFTYVTWRAAHSFQNFSQQATAQFFLTRLGGPSSGRYRVLPEKFLGYSRESNTGPLGWQSDVLTTIPKKLSPVSEYKLTFLTPPGIESSPQKLEGRIFMDGQKLKCEAQKTRVRSSG